MTNLQNTLLFSNQKSSQSEYILDEFANSPVNPLNVLRQHVLDKVNDIYKIYIYSCKEMVMFVYVYSAVYEIRHYEWYIVCRPAVIDMCCCTGYRNHV